MVHGPWSSPRYPARMQIAQQVRRQRETAQQLLPADLGQQAFQPDPAGICSDAGERHALAVIGQQGIQALARAGVETVPHAAEGLRRRVQPGPSAGYGRAGRRRAG